MPVDNKLSFNKMRNTFLFGLIGLLTLAVMYLFRPFLYPIFWAAVTAIMFYPFYTWLNKHIPSLRLNASLIIVAVIITILLPLSLVTTLLVSESIDLYQSVSTKNLSQALASASTRLEDTSFAPYVRQAQQEWPTYLNQATRTASATIFTSVKSVTQNSVRFMLMLFVMFYALFYFVKDGHKMLKTLMHLSPLGDKYETMLYHRFTSTTRATLKSTLIVGGIQGTLSGVLFWITGVEGAFIWGIIMVVAALIPAVGPAIILIPAGLVMLVLGNVWQGIVLLVGALLVSFLDNIIRPPLVGKDTAMHPLLIFFATLGGIILFGISGFVIGPIIAALYTSVMSIYEEYYRSELSNN
jgi:predicted PurR-regulated permease PerM